MLWRPAGSSSTYRTRDPQKRSPTKLASIRLCSDHGGHPADSFCDDRHNKPRGVFAIKREKFCGSSNNSYLLLLMSIVTTDFASGVARCTENVNKRCSGCSLSLSLSLWTGGNTYFSYLRIYVLLSPFAIIAQCNHNPVLDADEKNCKANTDPKTDYFRL